MRSGPWVLLVLLAAAGAALPSLSQLRFDHDTRSLLRADAASDTLEATLVERFGSEDILLLAWEVPDALDPSEFARARRVTDAVSALEGLEEVYSIASSNVLVPFPSGLRPIRAQDLEREIDRTRVRGLLRAATVYRGTLYDDALTVVACAGTLVPRDPALRAATIRRVRAIARAESREGSEIHVSGVSALALAASEYAFADLRRVGLAALIVSALVLLLLCGSLRETAVGLVTTALPPIYALGLAVLFDWPVTAMGAALFPVLGVVGITSTVHLFTAFHAEAGRATDRRARDRRARDRRTAAARAVRRVRVPITLSLLTTAAAFYSLHATGVPAFEAGGRIVGIGVLLAIPVVLVGVPAALGLVGPPPGRTAAARLDRPLMALSIRTTRRPLLWTAAGVTLLLASVPLALTAPVRIDVLQAFRPESEIARTYRFLEDRLTATLPVDVVWRVPEGTDTSVMLKKLRALERDLLALDGVDSVVGVQTLVTYGQSIMPFGENAALLFLRRFLGRITRRFEHAESGSVRLKVRVREGTRPEVLDLIERRASQLAPGEVTVTGLYVRAVHTTRALVFDLFRGVLLMVGVVVLITAAALRSWRAGLASLLPNLLPPAAVFGAAGLLGVALDVSAIAVGAIAVGLAIDDTIHMLYSVADETRAGRPLPRALLRTQKSVGRAVVLSTLALVAGLACLQASAFLPTARFGAFASAACLIALAGDLIVLPASLMLLRRL